MCEQLPAVAQQELLLLVRVALKSSGGGGVEYVAELVDVCPMPSHHSQLLSVDPQRAAGFPNPKAKP